MALMLFSLFLISILLLRMPMFLLLRRICVLLCCLCFSFTPSHLYASVLPLIRFFIFVLFVFFICFLLVIVLRIIHRVCSSPLPRDLILSIWRCVLFVCVSCCPFVPSQSFSCFADLCVCRALRLFRLCC